MDRLSSGKIEIIRIQIARLEKEPICLVCPIINDRFSITLSAAPVNILYISFPNPASDAFPRTKPCLQKISGGSSRTLEGPAMGNVSVDIR